MIIQACLVGAALLFLAVYLRRQRLDVPGPKGYPFVGVSHLMKPGRFHVAIHDWAKKYGSVYQFTIMGRPSVVVSGYDAIYEVAVKKGREFGSRPNTFRRDVVLHRTGILTSSEPDETWKVLRKTTHRHLKQFGDGMSRLESVIQDVGEDMFMTFAENAGKPYDPKGDIFDTALNSIAFLITGERTYIGDSIVEKMRKFELYMSLYLAKAGPWKYFMMDFMPWLRFFGLEIWDKISDMVKQRDNIWDQVMKMNVDNSASSSLCKILMEHASNSDVITETDAKCTSLNLLFAGVTTTTNTFYASINVLAHNQHIQDAVLKEIQSVCGDGREVSLTERSKMPYTRAFLFEVLRSTSVVAASVSRCPSEGDTVLGNFIPKGTRMFLDIWGMHNDPEFWQDPDVYRPERFLDSDGDMLPADHPNRKRLMPFGAGPRVCVGETLALARLFLWITKLVSRFKVQPAEGNLISSLDTKQFVFEGVLRCEPFKVILHPR